MIGTLRVNGRERTVRLEPSRSLLEVVRDEWGLSGTKYGCGEGVCGACKHLVDGIAVRACLTPIGEVVGRSVTTIEGLLLDRPDLPSAGAGETHLIAVAPAIANAIDDATGERIRHLPLLPGGRLPTGPRPTDFPTPKN